MTTALDGLVDRIAAERPDLHPGDRHGDWAMDPSALRMLARHVKPGQRTLEVGSGASTVIFAAAGATHLAISRDAGEHARIREYCQALGIDHERVTMLAGSSDRLLPTLPEEPPYDLALIDGAHSFPHPVVDFHHASGRLRAGGILMLDDVPIPSVGAVARHLRADRHWRLLEVAGGQAAAFLKLGGEEDGDDWWHQPFNRRYPDFCLSSRPEALARRVRFLGHRLRRRLGRRRR
jgi:predicted O-methyltransferase YrrM